MKSHLSLELVLLSTILVSGSYSHVILRLSDGISATNFFPRMIKKARIIGYCLSSSCIIISNIEYYE